MLYQPIDLNMDDFYSAHLITIETKGKRTYKIALLDTLLSSAKPCAVLKNDILTVILFSTILQINLNTKTIAKCVDCDNMGGLEKIYPVDGGYIIKGECDIFRYDNALNRVWGFGGRDIFASPAGDIPFWINGSEIHCRDWEGWHYVLYLNGSLVCEYPEEN